MITQEKLQTYEQFGGDIDALARASRHIEQSISDAEADWLEINTILGDLFLAQSGLASPDFEARARTEATALAENEYVLQRLLEVAKLRSRG